MLKFQQNVSYYNHIMCFWPDFHDQLMKEIVVELSKMAHTNQAFFSCLNLTRAEARQCHVIKLKTGPEEKYSCNMKKSKVSTYPWFGLAHESRRLETSWQSVTDCVKSARPQLSVQNVKLKTKIRVPETEQRGDKKGKCPHSVLAFC